MLSELVKFTSENNDRHMLQTIVSQSVR